MYTVNGLPGGRGERVGYLAHTHQHTIGMVHCQWIAWGRGGKGRLLGTHPSAYNWHGSWKTSGKTFIQAVLLEFSWNFAENIYVLQKQATDW